MAPKGTLGGAFDPLRAVGPGRGNVSGAMLSGPSLDGSLWQDPTLSAFRSERDRSFADKRGDKPRTFQRLVERLHQRATFKGIEGS